MEKEKDIFFYGKSGSYGCFRNFYIVNFKTNNHTYIIKDDNIITIPENTYICSEQYFMYV